MRFVLCVEVFGSAPREKMVDFDSDGRLDVLLRVNHKCGRYACTADFLYCHQSPDGTFVEPIENPFANIRIIEAEEYYEEIEFADWNSDGLQDIFFIKLGPSIGRSASADYMEQVVLRSVLPHAQFNPFKHIDLQDDELHLADVNDDGQAHLVIADNNCNGQSGPYCQTGGPLPLRLYQYKAGLNLKEVTGAFQNVTETDLGPFRVALVDWDQDGDSDLLVAAFDGRLHYHEMIGGKWQAETEPSVFANITFPVMAEPISWTEYNDTSGQWEEIERSYPRQTKVQPVPVDWDNDGDIDLVLGPEGWYWERLADGTLLEHPLERSPFRNVSGAEVWSVTAFSGGGVDSRADAAWRFVDCDLDGDWDLVRTSSRYEEHYRMQACEHDGSSLKCDPDFICLGMNLSDFRAGERVYSFDFTDLDGDRRPELLTGQNGGGIGLWSAGFCTPPDACHKKGICQPESETCACIAGHELHDCSGCEPNFYSVLKAGLGQMHNCKACPGSGGEVCHSRGVCFDDSRAKALANSSTAAFMAIGNGSCDLVVQSQAKNLIYRSWKVQNMFFYVFLLLVCPCVPLFPPR